MGDGRVVDTLLGSRAPRGRALFRFPRTKFLIDTACRLEIDVTC
jgi:hypothetical protein